MTTIRLIQTQDPADYRTGMVTEGARLGIDFGTSTTVAMMHRVDGSMTPLLFDASPLLASAVFAGTDTHLLTGADADRAAAAHPAGLEANPKRRIDDGTVWLGEQELPVVDLIAAVLRRVAEEAARVAGQIPPTVMLTHPATWSQTRLGILADAARRAGLGDVGLVAEPIAAAAYFGAVLGRDLPSGQCLVVYDLGAGTFDISVVRRSVATFEVMATDGLPNVGGLDLDATVVDHARSLTASATDAWGRLDWPETAADQRARRTLWLGARAAKEQLSRHAAADLHVPLADADLHLTRDEFDKAARPHLDRTVALTLATLRAAALPREHIAGIFLVGGSSRTPLVASLLHRALQIAPTIIDQPELVVAAGSLHTEPRARTTPSPTRPGTEPVPLQQATSTPAITLAVPPEPVTAPAPDDQHIRTTPNASTSPTAVPTAVATPTRLPSAPGSPPVPADAAADAQPPMPATTTQQALPGDRAAAAQILPSSIAPPVRPQTSQTGSKRQPTNATAPPPVWPAKPATPLARPASIRATVVLLWIGAALSLAAAVGAVTAAATGRVSVAGIIGGSALGALAIFTGFTAVRVRRAKPRSRTYVYIACGAAFVFGTMTLGAGAAAWIVVLVFIAAAVTVSRAPSRPWLQ
ncbi:Hsp70 family protein [Dactylosporangium sp. AC04546]|uniref:Hsp70 family protein n=1 Tax=Dactylosporangium sp. AC04546 TaxID=2862460 RepID=UPI001EDFA175|nr:Hsp70 family protein [Dactylosporangium sp. AC04546]WVK78901.1 Hsp70 family protein [Dactylosporangium sp. AC04546]